ncbi:hypothetical protein PSMK_16830 [Phycisphaera mikurensis NBRC 102666]|uniref:Uncharacterized protein n=1 Tax=Phycisphaera mikurensis (strain NBRC 102666 / KCTC 22515 / FYK2301M01) TaxID=1142394 RepID=I0IF04_PHYMF|nr:hypothetical protein PSMK_16830 [Phycisphaera mikurensis NBRC 102666]
MAEVVRAALRFITEGAEARRPRREAQRWMVLRRSSRRDGPVDAGSFDRGVEAEAAGESAGPILTSSLRASSVASVPPCPL